MSILFRHAADVHCSAQDAFRLYTDPARLCQRDPNVLEFEALGAAATTVGSQNRMVLDFGGNWLEVVETVVEYDPPHLIASRCDLRGFLPRGQSRPGEFVPSMSQLEEQFRWAFGSGEVYELMVLRFTPTGPETCRLEVSSQNQAGGLHWLEWQVRRLFGGNPLRAPVAGFLAQVGQTEAGTGVAATG